MSGNLVLDEQGDREPDFWITDMDPHTGEFVKIAEVVNLDLGKRVYGTLTKFCKCAKLRRGM